MAAQLGAHPSADDLVGFAAGKLDDVTAAVITTHLDGCPDCCRAVASLSGDDFLDRLRQAHSPGTKAEGRETSEEGLDTLGSRRSSPTPRPAPLGLADLPPELADNPHYEVLRELGRGGMGVVYLAKNKLMDRFEVLKVVNKKLLDYPGAGERFLREIRSAAKLSHPNIVTAHSALQIGELLVFAMEYVEGEDLAKVVKTRGPLPVASACYYVQQAALGLQHAFEKKMVHRDIKPQNLILASEGERRIVKVLDFGLAKAQREEARTEYDLTGAGQMLGTPDYIAPEQLQDAATADIRADIYSLGCSLYYLLSGSPPFKAKSLFDLVQAHMSKEATPLNQVRKDIPAELTAIVAKMMAKSPKDRYQTPIAVVQALAEARDESSSKRNKLIGGSIAAGVLLIGLLGLWAGGVFRLKTPEGTLVVEVNVPNPDVYVDGGKMTVTWDKGGKKAEIRIPAGTRDVKVTKDGFAAFGKQVTLSDGQSRVLTARLEQQPGVEPGPGGQTKGTKAAGTPVDEGSRAGEERDDNGLKLKLCWCPTGTTPGFWVGKYEVTQSEWADLMGSMPSHALDKGKGDRHPIYYVSHDDATKFCRILTDRERNAGRLPSGWAYRLPNEAQWEYACRAGTKTATAFGDKLDSTLANFNGDWPHNGAPKGPNLQKAVKVGWYRPNAWGICDMHGNVGEFTATPGRHRGGSWYDSGRNCCSEIFIPDPPNASEHVGFRVARVRD